MRATHPAHLDPARVGVRVEDAVAWVEMHDAESGNGFSPAFVGALLGAFDHVSDHPDAKVMVLSGTPDIFCSGATPEVIRDLRERRLRPTELALGRRLMDVPIPVIAAAEGHAIGGGFALMLSADLVVIAAESRYGANFTSLGITPGMGTTRLLESVFSQAVAHELLYTSELRRGEAFRGVSGFNAIVSRAQVRDRAHEAAFRIAEHPRETLVLLKRTLTMPKRRRLEEAMTLESLMHEISLERADPRNMPGALA